MILAFDLETVPCLTMASRLWEIDPEDPEAYEKIAARQLEDSEGKRDMVKPFAQRIVALGIVRINLEEKKAEQVHTAGTDEGRILRVFRDNLLGLPRLVGWNTLGFDLPVIRYRSLMRGLDMKLLYGPNRHHYDRYDYRFGDEHLDLMDILSGYGRSTFLTLEEAAALCDLPAKTISEGSKVLGNFRAGRHDVNEAYAAEDARTLARIFLRWWASRGVVKWSELEAIDEQIAAMMTNLVAAA